MPLIDIFPKKTYYCQQTDEKMLNVTNHQGNAIKTTMRYHFTFVKLLSKRQETTNTGEVVKKRGLVQLVKMWKLIQPLWKTVEKFFKRLKTELLYDPAISCMEFLDLDAENQHHSIKEISVFLCSTQHYSWQPRYGNNLSVDGCMENDMYMYAYKEYCSNFKKNNIRNNMNEPREHYEKKDKYLTRSLIWNLKKEKENK